MYGRAGQPVADCRLCNGFARIQSAGLHNAARRFVKVAVAVAKKAQEQGLARAEETDMAKAVRDLKWYPEYK